MENIKRPYLKDLTCYICDFYGKTDEYKFMLAQDIFHAGTLIRFKCPKCGVIFGDMWFLLLSLEEIGNDYTDLYSYYKEGDTTLCIYETLKSIGILNKSDKSKKILDYACGRWNNIISKLNNDGYDVKGYDKYIKSNNPNILNSIDGIKFDIIYSNNFIEHVINPVNDLNNILVNLNDDGILILISPCFEYVIEYSHFNTFFFVDNSLDYLCNKLNIKQIHSVKIKLSDGSFSIAKIFKKQGF